MEDKLLEMCKKVIDGETPRDSCQEVRCIDCPFGDEKIDCSINSTEACEIAQNYIKEHEKTVNTIEKIEEKPKYKVGDKVRVKSDLKAGTDYGSVWVNRIMTESGNKILTIEKNEGNKEYRVVENQWLWGEEMFEPVEENEDINSDLIEATVTLKELQEIKKDNIIPTYYHQGNYDVIQFCLDNNIDFVSGNIIKYITRYKGKNGLEDLKKAQEYLRRLKESKIAVFKEDLANFCDENNMTYTQGKIVECIITNDKDTAEVLIKELIRKEEKKIKEIEETYEAEGMAD